VEPAAVLPRAVLPERLAVVGERHDVLELGGEFAP